MKYYSRALVEIDSSGKWFYGSFVQIVKTNNIEKFNKGCIIQFDEDNEFKKVLENLYVDKVYIYDIREMRLLYENQ